MATKKAVEGIVIRSGDADSFAEMRRIQRNEQKVAQAAIKPTLPAGEIKESLDDREQIIGTPGPAITRGQQSKIDAMLRKGIPISQALKAVAPDAPVKTPKAPVKTPKAPVKKAAPKKAAPKKAAPKKAAPKKAAPKKATKKK